MKEFNEQTIDDFLLGRMDQKEQQQFENELSINDQLAEQVAQRKKSIQYIEVLGDLALKQRVQALHEQAKENIPDERKSLSLIRLLSYAASLALLITVGYWLFSSNDHTRPDVQYYEAYELNFNNRNGDFENRLTRAGKFYREGDYQNALQAFSQLPQEAVNAKVTLAKGICFIELAQYPDAIRTFQSLLDPKDPIYEEQARWYTAIAYLKAKEPTNAKNILQQIIANPNHFQYESATKILDLL